MAKKQRSKRVVRRPSSIVSDEIFIPNHSGTHDAGTREKVPTGELDLVNKKYVDDQDALYVLKTGDTMTGALTLPTGANSGLKFGDGDTDISEYLPNELAITIAGTHKYTINNNYMITGESNTRAGINSELGTATNPTLLPRRQDSDTGIGWVTDNQMSLIAGGARIVSVKAGGLETPVGAKLATAQATATTPSLMPSVGDNNTGIGRAGADQLSLIAGGVEGIRIKEDTTIQTNMADKVYIGDTTSVPRSNKFLDINSVENYTSGTAGVGVQSPGNVCYVMRDSNNNVEGSIHIINPNMLVGTLSNDNLQFRTNSVVGMTMDTSQNVGIGTTTPTIKFSTNEKVGYTSIGGMAIKLTNTTGAVTIAGQLVKPDPDTDDAVILTGVDDQLCIGVFLDSGVADDAEAWVVISGIADVAYQDNVSANRGNWVKASGEAGYASDGGATPGHALDHWREIGHCIEDVTATGGGTHILARCVLHFN